MWELPFTVTCPSADVTVRCCTARLHPLSARNLETNVTDCVEYHSYFVSLLRRSRPCIFASFLPVMFQQPSVCLSRLSDTDGTGRLAIFTRSLQKVQGHRAAQGHRARVDGVAPPADGDSGRSQPIIPRERSQLR